MSPQQLDDRIDALDKQARQLRESHVPVERAVALLTRAVLCVALAVSEAGAR